MLVLFHFIYRTLLTARQRYAHAVKFSGSERRGLWKLTVASGLHPLRKSYGCSRMDSRPARTHVIAFTYNLASIAFLSRKAAELIHIVYSASSYYLISFDDLRPVR